MLRQIGLLAALLLAVGPLLDRMGLLENDTSFARFVVVEERVCADLLAWTGWALRAVDDAPL